MILYGCQYGKHPQDQKDSKSGHNADLYLILKQQEESDYIAISSIGAGNADRPAFPDLLRGGSIGIFAYREASAINTTSVLIFRKLFPKIRSLKTLCGDGA
jgi:hypothetical protein